MNQFNSAVQKGSQKENIDLVIMIKPKDIEAIW